MSENEEENPLEDCPENVEQHGVLPGEFSDCVFQSPDEEEAYEGQCMSEEQLEDLLDKKQVVNPIYPERGFKDLQGIISTQGFLSDRVPLYFLTGGEL